MATVETSCLFCRIARDEIPAVTVHADDRRYIAQETLTLQALPHPGDGALAEAAAILRAELERPD